jgi:hypothetical protein
VNFLSQLLPGFRHVRAPLISGYLWLLAAWLLFADDLPRQHDSPVYGRAGELADAIGPVGVALVVSVAAYLVGSLVQFGLSSLGFWLSRFWRRIRRPRSVAITGPAWLRIDHLLGAAYLARDDIGRLDGDVLARERLRDLAQTQLGPSGERLETAILRAQSASFAGCLMAGATAKPDEVVVSFNAELKRPVTASFVRGLIVGAPGRDLRVDFDENRSLPVFSAERDLFASAGQSRPC